VAVISGAFLLAVIFQSVVALALGVQSLEAIQGQPGLYTVLSASTFVGFIVAAVGFLSLREEWAVLHVRRPTLRDVAFVVGGLLALAVAATVTSALVSAIIAVLDSTFGVDAQFATNEVIETGQRNPTTFLYMIPVAILLVGPGEELVFRGVVQGCSGGPSASSRRYSWPASSSALATTSPSPAGMPGPTSSSRERWGSSSAPSTSIPKTSPSPWPSTASGTPRYSPPSGPTRLVLRPRSDPVAGVRQRSDGFYYTKSHT